MNKQAIALDMDGTLLDPVGNITDNLHQLIVTLRQKGIYIFLATGRTRKEVEDVLPESFKVDGVVCANGMETYIDETQLEYHVLDEELVKDIVELARKEKLYYEIHPLRGSRYALFADKTYMEMELQKSKPISLLENEYISRIEALRTHIKWTNTLFDQNIVKVYFFSMDKRNIIDWEIILHQMKRKHPFSTSSSSLHNIEMMVANVSKATGIKKLLNHYQLSNQTLLAIGDGENDLSMFELANHAIAMKNAANFVKSKADEITTYSYEEDGLFQFLKEHWKDS
ncbi:HAD family hydrolase [Pseudogracilibacillus auburnensis]|uniref:HAD family hydrolase n=1 Tax=Pseudogracilibacillus auburnensis TaxID=1494959 RepID=UPI001A967C7C|nr:HAD family hydrolase [Pseudogracilibacillus auburnensis]MBO1002480.1 HAD family hydrolase [Pseudogracilibacillus auburnensis]